MKKIKIKKAKTAYTENKDGKPIHGVGKNLNSEGKILRYRWKDECTGESKFKNIKMNPNVWGEFKPLLKEAYRIIDDQRACTKYPFLKEPDKLRYLIQIGYKFAKIGKDETRYLNKGRPHNQVVEYSNEKKLKNGVMILIKKYTRFEKAGTDKWCREYPFVKVTYSEFFRI